MRTGGHIRTCFHPEKTPTRRPPDESSCQIHTLLSRSCTRAHILSNCIKQVYYVTLQHILDVNQSLIYPLSQIEIALCTRVQDIVVFFGYSSVFSVLISERFVDVIYSLKQCDL
jgi:hypothetical protein